ncbi:hypothetical protein EDD92_9715 [Streptomyces sp. TLI_185]|nr:hypothetical protein EDD92_9715 [Streptomyces sp. TLI_185]
MLSPLIWSGSTVSNNRVPPLYCEFGDLVDEQHDQRGALVLGQAQMSEVISSSGVSGAMLCRVLIRS